MKKNTKIVATIGPATETEEIIRDLIKAGMNVARFNTKHGTPQWHQDRIKRVRRVAKEMDVSIGILLDLQGPEIRINLPEEKDFDMKEGDIAVFSHDKSKSDKNLILIPENVVHVLQRGNFILLDDGVCEFEITQKHDDYFSAKALSDFSVKHRKTMNTPGITIDMPSLIDNDFIQLDGVTNDDIDFVGLSFVRDKKDIKILRSELEKRNLDVRIISKIENQSALDHIDEIIAVSDAIMVARGDLAVEVPFEQLSFWQKLIITKCRFASKPVITATQMLKSMVDHPRPTRAEVSDIANAIYDQTSAVMLSEETTIGKYPVKAVETQAKIASFNEQYVESDLEDWIDKSDPACVTHAAAYLLKHRAHDIDAVVCLTKTGNTARLLSRFRPNVTVIAVTESQYSFSEMSLLYGVKPHFTSLKNHDDYTSMVINELKDKGLLKKDQTIVFIYGSAWGVSGKTNSFSLINIK